MTTAPVRPRKPTVQREFAGMPLEDLPGHCKRCVGRRAVWCPGCCGFGGCSRCQQTGMLPCPECAGGPHVPVIMW